MANHGAGFIRKINLTKTHQGGCIEKNHAVCIDLCEYQKGSWGPGAGNEDGKKEIRKKREAISDFKMGRCLLHNGECEACERG